MSLLASIRQDIHQRRLVTFPQLSTSLQALGVKGEARGLGQRRAGKPDRGTRRKGSGNKGKLSSHIHEPPLLALGRS